MFEWALSTPLLPLYEIRSPNTCSETIETFWVFDSVSLLSFVALFDGFNHLLETHSQITSLGPF